MSKDREELIEVIWKAMHRRHWREMSDQEYAEHQPMLSPGMVENWRDEARHALSAIEGAGFVVLPRIPTGEMCLSGMLFHLTTTDAMLIYESMINAYSPKPSGVEDE